MISYLDAATSADQRLPAVVRPLAYGGELGRGPRQSRLRSQPDHPQDRETDDGEKGEVPSRLQGGLEKLCRYSSGASRSSSVTLPSRPKSWGRGLESPCGRHPRQNHQQFEEHCCHIGLASKRRSRGGPAPSTPWNVSDDTVQVNLDGVLLSTHRVRHDRLKEFGALARPNGSRGGTSWSRVATGANLRHGW